MSRLQRTTRLPATRFHALPLGGLPASFHLNRDSANKAHRSIRSWMSPLGVAASFLGPFFVFPLDSICMRADEPECGWLTTPSVPQVCPRRCNNLSFTFPRPSSAVSVPGADSVYQSVVHPTSLSKRHVHLRPSSASSQASLDSFRLPRNPQSKDPSQPYKPTQVLSSSAQLQILSSLPLLTFVSLL